ncbi:hypothetical protein KI387_026019, partial [Taxus chinensis]
MDSEGVWKYMAEHRRDVQAVTVEMRPALESVVDPARLVLEAIEDPIMGEDHPIVARVLRSGLRPLQINGSQRLLDGELANAKLLEVQAFLQLLATFGIVAEFERDFLRKLVMSVSWRKYIAKLCGALGLLEIMPCAWSLTRYIYVMPIGVVLSFFDLENLLFLYRMDSEGVWKYMAEHKRDVQAVTVEMRPTLESAVDPARLVLEAIE